MYGYNDDSKSLGGDNLKRVSYSIWFKKPDFEVLLLEQRYDLIDYPTDGVSLAAIKVSEFFTDLRATPSPIPPRWKGGNHPPGEYGYDNPTRPNTFSTIPPDDRQYIKFEYDVTAGDEKPPTKYDRDNAKSSAEQAASQREIATQQKEIAKLLKEFLS